MEKRIHFWVDDYAGCAWYRGHVPGAALKRLGHEVTLDVSLDRKTLPELDVLVLQRKNRPAELEAVRFARQHGIRTVFDLDDNLWDLDPNNPSYDVWQDRQRIGMLEEIMRSVDVVTTTTPPLQRLFSRLNTDVRILPNMLPGEHWPESMPEHEEDKRPLVIGWAGSRHHHQDLRLLDGVIQTVLDSYRHVEFYIAGPRDVPLRPHRKIRPVSGVQVERLQGLLASFDIGLAPIVDNRFNDCKSDLKYIEYSMMGIPTIASDAGPYARSIKHGKDGLLACNAKDWLKHIRRLVEDMDFRLKLGEAARRRAEERTIDENVDLWEDAMGLR